ncbi:MAG: NAD(P)H-hydrate dehydratase [Acidilobaceae archaeon]
MEGLATLFKKAEESEAIASEEMSVIEANSAWWGVSQELLMENAGRALADFVSAILRAPRDARIAVVAGRGGNGGDGLVAARFLAARGARVEIHLTHEPSLVEHRAARRALDYAIKSRSVKVKKPWSEGWLDLSSADLVIDAVLGTGLRGEPRGTVRDAIVAINSSRAVKVAADIPSGLDPDTGRAVLAVRADYTLSFHKPKRGLFLNEGPRHAGEVYVADIGVPAEAEEYAGPGDLLRVPERPRDARKGDGGRVLVVGGSERFVGAPVLAAKAAYLAGADLVYAYLPREYAYTVASCHPEVIPVPRESPGGLEEALERAHAVVLGPGLGLSDESRRIVKTVIERYRGRPLVVDADALKIIAEEGAELWSHAVMTPHRGEALALSKKPEASLVEQARVIAARYGATVIVKAPEDVVCEPRGRCRRNLTGHQAMAVGGTGDILAGIIGGFLARRAALSTISSPLDLVAAAAYVTGRAGELAVEEKGENLTPQDVLSKIPVAMAEARRYSETREVARA